MIFLIPLMLSAFCDANRGTVPIYILLLYFIVFCMEYAVKPLPFNVIFVLLFELINLSLWILGYYKTADAMILAPLILYNPYILPLAMILVIITKNPLKINGFIPAITLATVMMV